MVGISNLRGLQLLGAVDEARCRAIPTQRIRLLVEQAIAKESVNEKDLQHLASCTECRARAEGYAMFLGFNLAGTTIVGSQELATALPTAEQLRVLPPPVKRQYEFTMPDRAFIVRDATAIGRLFDVNFVYLSASANAAGLATIAFTLDGGLVDLIEFEREWPRHLEIIHNTRVPIVASEGTEMITFRVSADGVDTKGIVARFVDMVPLRAHAILTSLTAEVVPGRGVAGSAFELHATIRATDKTHRARVLYQLERWAEDAKINVNVAEQDLPALPAPQLVKRVRQHLSRLMSTALWP